MQSISLNNWLACKNIRAPQLYLVGGTVRDLMLDRVPKDIDVVCKGAKGFACALAKGKGAALVPMEKKPDEPCYRVIERDRPDNFLDIAEMRGEDIYDDLKQRDFTINAIAIELDENGSPVNTIDPLNGNEDIQEKVIRLTNRNSLVADPLRILRVVRFAATLNFSAADATWEEMQMRASMLARVSAERIMAELLVILGSLNASFFFRKMDDLGILDAVFPEIKPMKGCAQNGFHHKDVWQHSLLVMENCENIINRLAEHFGDISTGVADNLNKNNRLEFLKLAALLHDIGKPTTAGSNPDTGRITFYRHDEYGAKIIDALGKRLKMSTRDREFMVSLTAEHLHALTLASRGVKASTRMRWFRKMADDSVPAIILGMADVMSSLGPESGEDYRIDFIARLQGNTHDYFADIKAKIERPDFVNGNDLISIGIAPGPVMGRVLDQLRNAQDTGEIGSREEGIEMAKRLIGMISGEAGA